MGHLSAWWDRPSAAAAHMSMAVTVAVAVAEGVTANF
jgi:hypothetical protein